MGPRFRSLRLHNDANVNERRNYGRRAEMLRRVVNRLRARRGGVLPTELASEVPQTVAERILKRLAFRGLVREAAGKWLPTPVLLYDIPLVPVS